ncbi:DUF6346 domain-containing protein [Actinopolyspora mortivallis]|uniref:Uncharacterized protein n=1 Tax=Actinopolyspora mortivallis TaxID=33906 RepID=A0A2T0GU94_ACTMO|nr:DUF6346 domain-containing protein [Actinopolyspora mortivallis]PRW62664.1 hypothetical protein CEP50_14205 [Actinopolyspora mortivallis]
MKVFVRLARDVVLIPLGLLLFAASILVVIPFFGLGAVGSEVTDRGTAVAQRCRFAGPIADSQSPDGGSVVGFGHICRARVTWQDGTTEMREVTGSQLTPDDIGREVAVVERAVDTGNGGSTSTEQEVYRQDYRPKPVLGVIGILATGLPAVGCVLFGWANLRARFGSSTTADA